MFRYVLALTVVLAGCATQPLYSPAKNSDSVGYYETRLTDDRYRITFTGGMSTSAETVKNYALLRAAQVTADNGFDWFQIMDRDSAPNEKADGPKVTVSVGVGSGGYGRCYPFGCRAYGSPYYTGIGLSTSESRNRHQSVIEIFMGKGDPDDPTKVYNAEELIKNLEDQPEK